MTREPLTGRTTPPAARATAPAMPPEQRSRQHLSTAARISVESAVEG